MRCKHSLNSPPGNVSNIQGMEASERLSLFSGSELGTLANYTREKIVESRTMTLKNNGKLVI
jgi:hypothetical protein